MLKDCTVRCKSHEVDTVRRTLVYASRTRVEMFPGAAWKLLPKPLAECFSGAYIQNACFKQHLLDWTQVSKKSTSRSLRRRRLPLGLLQFDAADLYAMAPKLPVLAPLHALSECLQTLFLWPSFFNLSFFLLVATLLLHGCTFSTGLPPQNLVRLALKNVARLSVWKALQSSCTDLSLHSWCKDRAAQLRWQQNRLCAASR